MGDQFIVFNVAGQRFTTSKETILKEPASRIALIMRGVLPATKDELGAIFLDRDARYFQLVLNYLRDGWCQLPKRPEERRELQQEVRYYQLAGMETWMRTQDPSGEPPLPPQPPKPYTSPNAAFNSTNLSSSSVTHQQLPHDARPRSTSSYMAGYAYSSDLGGSPGYPIRSSFLTGANQDLLTAGAFAGIRPSTLQSPPHRSSCIHSPEPTGFSSSGVTLSPSVAARPSSASHCIGGTAGSAPVGVAVGYAAGFAAGQQQTLAHAAAAVRRSITPVMYASPMDFDRGAASPAATLGNNHVPGPSAQEGFKWTSRYLANNAKMQEVAETLLELAYLPPHASLHSGKASISFNSECDDDRISSLLGSSALDSGRYRYQVIRVQSTMGWSFEFGLRPSSDLTLYDKYNIAEYIQDNWFVLTACMKDMYGVVLEEDHSAKPKCVACRRSDISITLQKPL